MRSRLASAALLVALAAAIVWFVRRDSGADDRAPAASSADATAGVERATLPPLVRRRPRLAMPAPAVADVVVPEACAHGTGGTDAWWACLPRDPAWDAERASYLLERIANHVGLALDPNRVECRARCCRLRLTHEENRAHGGELSSSVGVRVGPTDGYLRDVVDRADPAGDVLVTTCWKQGAIEDFPDRAIEREIVLAEVAGELTACGSLAEAPAEATLNVELAPDGAIDTISYATAMPRPVMECISAALRKVGVFEPAPTTMDRMIPMRVRLRPRQTAEKP